MSPEEENLTIYYLNSSSCSQKVLLYLAEKGMEINHHVVDMGKSEIYQPAYMKMNPQGKVPLLTDGDKCIPESSVIIKYIEDRFKNKKAMLPTDPEALKTCMAFWEHMDQIFGEITTLTFGTFIFPQYVKNPKVSPAVIEGRADIVKNSAIANLVRSIKASLLEDAKDLHEIYDDKIKAVSKMKDVIVSEQRLVDALIKTGLFLDEVEEQLVRMEKECPDRQHWLVTEAFTVPDAALAVLLNRLDYVGFSDRFWGAAANRPMIVKYFQQLCRRPSFKEICLEKGVWK